MSLKQTYYCPHDNTKLIKIPKETDSLHIQADGHSKPSRIYKFIHAKTDEPSYHHSFKKFRGAENANLFYKAKDIWEFDNIGVSKPPSNVHDAEYIKMKNEDGETHHFAIVRYLVCGTCDQGIFGFGGYPSDLEDLEDRSEIGFDVTSVNPNDLVYFFYL